MDIEELLGKPYLVIDVLPKQVPADCPGGFFAVEQYLLAHPQVDDLKARKLSFLLKLYCYYNMRISSDVCETWTENPRPGELRAALNSYLYLYLPRENTLITADPCDLNMTLYNASDELLGLIGQLAASEGFFVWRPAQD